MKKTTYELLVLPNTNMVGWCIESESGSLKKVRKDEKMWIKMGKKTRIIRIVTETSVVRKSQES